MSQILTKEKTIELGQKIQEELLDFQKYVSEHTAGGMYLINRTIFDTSTKQELSKIVSHMEILLENLICFCGGCSSYGVECKDVFEAYAFLFDLYDEQKKKRLYEEICSSDESFLTKFHKIYYKVSARTNELKRKN